MRRILLILAALLAVSIVTAWAVTGAHVGWTKTQVQVMQVDPVTELEFPVWHNQLVFGVDFLALGLAGSAAVAAAAILLPMIFRASTKNQQP